MKQHYFAANGKRDIHGIEQQYDAAIIKLENDEQWKFEENRKIVLAYLKSCKRGKVKSAGRNKRVSKATLYRVLGILRLLSDEWLGKNFDQASREDWENFYDGMEDDEIKSQRGKPFQPSTKAKNYKTIRKFLKWRYGQDKYYPEICEHWVTEEEIPTKDAFGRAVAERMVLGARTLKGKARVMTLFDGGFREEEHGNLRWLDLTKQEDKGYYVAHVRKETSKTKKERYVSLGLSTEYIDNYKKSEQQRLGKDFHEGLYLFPENYGSLYKFLTRLSLRTVGKAYSSHDFRHSSATFYADIIETYQDFCARYGWDLNSKTAQRYFHKRGADRAADKLQEHQNAKFQFDIERIKLERDHLQEQLKTQGQEIVDIKAHLKLRDLFLFKLIKALDERREGAILVKVIKEEGLVAELEKLSAPEVSISTST